MSSIGAVAPGHRFALPLIIHLRFRTGIFALAELVFEKIIAHKFIWHSTCLRDNLPPYAVVERVFSEY